LTVRPYATAAEHYARYRPPYPEPMLADLRARTGLDGRQRLVDLACGTGEVALALLPYCGSVLAVDAEPAMLKVGRAKAGCGVRWVLARAEDVSIPPRSVDLVTVGNAFHRLDRALVAGRTLDWLVPGGHLALLNTTSVWRGTEEWQRVAVEVIAAWTAAPAERAPARRPPRRQPAPTAGRVPAHAEVIRDAGFEQVEEYSFPTRYTWSLDSFVGYLYSTAVVSPAVLGERAAGFERELRRALLAREPTGQLVETIGFDLLLARAG
jgi:SAM-dependent methyltransferase